jgi:fused signal recognition particle receptor
VSDLFFVLLFIAVVAGGLVFVLIRISQGSRGSQRAVGSAGAPATGGRTSAGRGGLGSLIRSVFRDGAAPDTWDRLEELLVLADAGPATAARIVADVRSRYVDGSDPVELVAAEIRDVLGDSGGLDLPEGRLGVVMVVGVNGSGKTTTIGKLAALLARDGKAVSLAGSDTFRAAASEQLDVWARRAGAHLVVQERGADPGSVAFDAVMAAQARGSDVLIVDTAGRLHTKQPLMDELAKVRRVLEKASGHPPDETILVLDATTGQNGVAQARAFTEAVDVTAVALTKLDGTAKGGIVLAVTEQLGVPVKLIGVGGREQYPQPLDPMGVDETRQGG